MENYSIEYIKGSIGSPSFERVTLVSDHKISGDCYEFDKIPNVLQFKSITDCFKFWYHGEFEVQYQWQDFKKDWHNCDKQKAIFLAGKGKPTRIIMKFIK